MLSKQTRIIYQNVSQSELEACLRGIVKHHRIQGSPGYHDAAVFCRDRLLENGISSAEILEYPAKEGVYFQNAPSFDFWTCRRAWCKLTQTGEMLADFAQQPFSIIQRSGPWLDKERELEVVDLDRGIEESAYADIDFHGKLVFVHEEYSYVRDWAIEKRGAAGYITDYVEPEQGVRDRASMHNIQKYTSFWWRPGQKRVFGFVLTPDAGDRLRALCIKMKREGKRPTVRCYVDSEFSEGALEVVTALLPGQCKEEILLCAHLCHPLGSANDNASGSTAVLQAIICLQQMLAEGALPPLQRSIRILLVPEIIGSYAYLDGISEAERKNIRLALTLDMVGGKQENRGPLTLYETPHCTPSIGNSIAMAVLDELQRDVPSLNTMDHIALYHSAVKQYIDGSDHGVYNDPSLAISSPLLCQWPDQTYHTSGDTVDVIDFGLLRHSCALAASYAYHAATLSIDDFPMLAQINLRRMQEVLSQIVFHVLDNQLSGEALAGFAADALRYYIGCLKHFVALVPEAETQISAEVERLKQVQALCIAPWLPNQRNKERKHIDFAEGKWIPHRSFFGKMDYGFSWICATHKDGFPEFGAYQKAVGSKYPPDMESSVLYYMNGQRTLGEISELVSNEFGVDAWILTVSYAKLLEAAGLVWFTGGDGCV